jgi:riboflavin synthase
MFTGIVEEVGEITAAQRRADVLVVRVRARTVTAGLTPGASIAVNGCCLTAVETSADGFTCDVTRETLDRTGFAERLIPGAVVNLERPMRADGRFDGHIVQGHVDGRGEILALQRSGEAAELSVAVPPRPRALPRGERARSQSTGSRSPWPPSGPAVSRSPSSVHTLDIRISGRRVRATG